MNDIVWLTMRRLRTPLIVLIMVFFVSTCILVLVPGQDLDGNTVHMTFLEASYFLAILATTIGLGEVPYPFTDLQRMVVFLLTFPNVVAWLYSIGAILLLFSDAEFKRMLERSRFGRRVEWISDNFHLVDLFRPHRLRRRVGQPFYLLCGFGSAGELLALGMLNRGLLVVAIDQDQQLIYRRRLDDRFAGVPMLAGPSSDLDNLKLAGLCKESCQGVIAATGKDQSNLTVAITTRLLRQDLPVFARAHDPRTAKNLASFIDEDHVVDPYALFASRLELAFTSPVRYQVQDWLLSVPGTRLRDPLNPPNGLWVICGKGRFGSRVLDALERSGQVCRVIDVHPERVEGLEGAVLGRGTEADTLLEAGIQDAVGVVAGTGDDIDNLSIALTALELNDKLFVVARQEHPHNEELFDQLFTACRAHLVARPSLIVARRILALATTPLLKTFLEHLVSAKDAFAERARGRLERALVDTSTQSLWAPSVWVTNIEGEDAVGFRAADEEGVTLRLDHLLHNTRTGEDEDLRCVCLMHQRGSQRTFLPEPGQDLREGDELLFAGRGSARREITRALRDPVLLLDYATPQRIPRTSIGRWLAKR